jgi:hypothetical protein
MIAASPPKAVSLPLCGIATAVQDAAAQFERNTRLSGLIFVLLQIE